MRVSASTTQDFNVQNIMHDPTNHVISISAVVVITIVIISYYG